MEGIRVPATAALHWACAPEVLSACSCLQALPAFFVGILILSSKSLFATCKNYANDALILFVQHFRKLYGDTYVSYNVHNLVHLAQDAKVHGTLDCFSAFCFENYMKTLKKRVRKPQSPSSQVVKQILERGSAIPIPRMVELGLKREHVIFLPFPDLRCLQVCWYA